MSPITMAIAPHGQIEEIDRELCVVYRGDDRAFALRAALEGLEAFAAIPENREMVCDALDRYAPELAILAGHVATIHRLEDVDGAVASERGQHLFLVVGRQLLQHVGEAFVVECVDHLGAAFLGQFPDGVGDDYRSLTVELSLFLPRLLCHEIILSHLHKLG